MHCLFIIYLILQKKEKLIEIIEYAIILSNELTFDIHSLKYIENSLNISSKNRTYFLLDKKYS